MKPIDPYIDCGFVVYLQRGRNKTMLRTGLLTTKTGIKIGGNIIRDEDIFGEVVKEEMLKPSALYPPRQ